MFIFRIYKYTIFWLRGNAQLHRNAHGGFTPLWPLTDAILPENKQHNIALAQGQQGRTDGDPLVKVRGFSGFLIKGLRRDYPEKKFQGPKHSGVSFSMTRSAWRTDVPI